MSNIKFDTDVIGNMLNRINNEEVFYIKNFETNKSFIVRKLDVVDFELQEWYEDNSRDAGFQYIGFNELVDLIFDNEMQSCEEYEF